MTEHLLEIQQKLDSPNEAIALFGNQDAYLKLMENELNVSIITRGEKVYVSGEEASRDTVSRLITSLYISSVKELRYLNGMSSMPLKWRKKQAELF